MGRRIGLDGQTMGRMIGLDGQTMGRMIGLDEQTMKVFQLVTVSISLIIC